MKWFIVALLLVPVEPTCAEPSPVVRYLQNEPVTMWDWGLFQVTEHLQELDPYPIPTSRLSKAHYDPQRQKIALTILESVFRDDVKTARAQC